MFKAVSPPSLLSLCFSGRNFLSGVRDEETLAWIKDYFQLDVDLVILYDQWSKRDPVFGGLKSRFSGIRILRQDPWETLVSFICSSNNNIPRITNMVHALCKHYSPALITLPPPSLTGSGSQGATAYHPFPPPSVLAAPNVKSTLRALGFGYRADYIQRTAKMLVDTHGSSVSPSGIRESCEGWLNGLRQMSTEDAREELLKFVGVGRKVADCVLLMSLDKKEVIPVDTHVHKIAVKHYGLRTTGNSKTKSSMTPQIYEQVTVKLMEVWGDYAGWAHSVLFTADLKAFSIHNPALATTTGNTVASSSGIQIPTPATTTDNMDASSSGIQTSTPATTPGNVDASAAVLQTLKRTCDEMQRISETQQGTEARRRLVVMVVAAAAAAFVVAHTVSHGLLEDDNPSSTDDDENPNSTDDDAGSPRRKRRKGSSD